MERIPLTRLLCDADVTKSHAEARRIIHQGGIKVDGERVRDISAELEPADGTVITVGKRTTLTREGKAWKVDIQKR